MSEKFKDSEIYFFPYDQNLISHTAIQNSEIGKNSFTHKVLRSNQKILSPNIKGVISFKSNVVLIFLIFLLLTIAFAIFLDLLSSPK